MTEPVYVAIYSDNLKVGGERPIKIGNSMQRNVRFALQIAGFP